VDLEQDLRARQPRHLDERGRREVAAEELLASAPDLLVVLHVGDVDVHLHDVVDLPAGRFDQVLDLREDHLRLLVGRLALDRDEVVSAGGHARHVDDVADAQDVRPVAGRVLRDVRRDETLLLLGHSNSPFENRSRRDRSRRAGRRGEPAFPFSRRARPTGAPPPRSAATPRRGSGRTPRAWTRWCPSRVARAAPAPKARAAPRRVPRSSGRSPARAYRLARRSRTTSPSGNPSIPTRPSSGPRAASAHALPPRSRSP